MEDILLLLEYHSNTNDDINSFQNGVDKIYNKCKSLGSTPTNNTPDSIIKSIQSIYDKAKSSGGVYYIGSGTSFNIKSLFPNDYSRLTNNNFIVVPNNGSAFSDGSWGDLRNVTTIINYSGSYNASTGVFNCSGNIQHNIMYSSNSTSNYGSLPLSVYVSLTAIISK